MGRRRQTVGQKKLIVTQKNVCYNPQCLSKQQQSEDLDLIIV